METIVQTIADRPSESECIDAFMYGFCVFMAFGAIAHAFYLSRKVVNDATES